MAGMSSYLETALLNHILRSTSYTAPTTIAVALCTSSLTSADTTLSGKEVANSNGYARQTVGPGTSIWAAPSAGATSNNNTITFGPATGSWGTVTYVAICDSATYNGGNMLFFGALASSKTVGSGDTVNFNATNLSITLS